MSKHNKKFHQAAKLTKSPMDEAECLRQFEEACDKGQYTKATGIAAAACKVFPDNWYFQYLHAESLYHDGCERWEWPHLEVLETIKTTCEKIIDSVIENPGTVSAEKIKEPYILRAAALLRRGQRLASMGKPEESRNAFLDSEEQFIGVLELWPDDLTTITGYAQSLMGLGVEEKGRGETSTLAKECLLRGIELDKAHGRGYVNCSIGYAIVLMRGEEYAEALEVFDAALEHCPGDKMLVYGRELASNGLNGGAGSKCVGPNLFGGDQKLDLKKAVANTLAKTLTSAKSPSRAGLPLRL